VLSQVASEAGAVGASPGEKTQFGSQLSGAQRDIAAFSQAFAGQRHIVEFENSFRDLTRRGACFTTTLG